MGTHQELEMFGSQPAYPEKLLHKKESLQNQLINIRVELSQASTVGGSPSTTLPVPVPAPFPVPIPIHPSRSSRQSSVPHDCCPNPSDSPNPQALANSTAEYESLESEVSALHDDLWEQLNLDIQVSGTPTAPGDPRWPQVPPTSPSWCRSKSAGSFSPLLLQGADLQAAADLCPALATAGSEHRGADEAEAPGCVAFWCWRRGCSAPRARGALPAPAPAYSSRQETSRGRAGLAQRGCVCLR